MRTRQEVFLHSQGLDVAYLDGIVLLQLCTDCAWMEQSEPDVVDVPQEPRSGRTADSRGKRQTEAVDSGERLVPCWWY